MVGRSHRPRHQTGTILSKVLDNLRIRNESGGILTAVSSDVIKKSCNTLGKRVRVHKTTRGVCSVLQLVNDRDETTAINMALASIAALRYGSSRLYHTPWSCGRSWSTHIVGCGHTEIQSPRRGLVWLDLVCFIRVWVRRCGISGCGGLMGRGVWTMGWFLPTVSHPCRPPTKKTDAKILTKQTVIK